ncbi:hypothetical protein P168DRAFT_278084 [Aspergillus campestris IBT 28561]|uniref:Uncharacterized protein n=1 Tax=Aspergillus campestris (strain IBT 28561) TaxID=1392248 RepID=A0A2I1DF41_ASPC2|nr:uncharacterized protein P168DRAFT_278084 [Aspergillus campestris IBT 28561]PKY08502.1 hypothetical protein P168DRAFT_278084 [Aspergillus campestris IBT 28561]
MSGKDSPPHPPAGFTGSSTSQSSGPSQGSLSRRGQSSSGESSITSRIDSSDRWRLGGPGPLPGWPLVYNRHPGFEIPERLANAAIEIATQHARELPYSLIQVVCVHTEGDPPKREDLTLNIRGDLSARHSQWMSMLDTLIQVLLGMGWFGRIEIIDNRATEIKSFPPKLPQQAIANWEFLLSGVIQRLESHQLPHVLILPMNRGYWEDISVPTIIARVQKGNASTSTMNQASQVISEFLHGYGLHLELTGDHGLWGLFGTSGSQPVPRLATESGTLGWPFNRGYNNMGMSVARKEVADWSGTIGGYLEYDGHALGITCHHVLRKGLNEQVDLDIDDAGGKNLLWKCQSPSAVDVQTIKTQLSGQIPRSPLPSTLPAAIIAAHQRETQEAATKLEQVESYKVSLGNVAATSGWRNVPLQAQPRPAPPVEMLMDWAIVDMSPSHWPQSVNFIGNVAGELAQDMNPATSHWTCQDFVVQTVAKQGLNGEAVFKRGRSTGLTTGELDRLAPASFRIPEVPQRPHHRCFIVAPYPDRVFAATGDSGSWCLNGNGEVLGILIGGDPTGAGLVIPMKLVIENMEAFLKLPSGSLKLPGAQQGKQP